MIRERRPGDLDRLCAIAAALEAPRDCAASGSSRAWLEAHDAEQSWVYDMAPVRLDPTKNVVGHVQIYRPAQASATPGLAECARGSASDLLAIGRFLVKPQKHDYGIARHLLNESRRYIQRQGKTAVLDLRANTYLTKEFCEKYGFAEVACEDPAAAPMIYTG
jgi:ribosomal protein S18 acetylase RimI-like enzyme